MIRNIQLYILLSSAYVYSLIVDCALFRSFLQFSSRSHHQLQKVWIFELQFQQHNVICLISILRCFHRGMLNLVMAYQFIQKCKSRKDVLINFIIASLQLKETNSIYCSRDRSAFECAYTHSTIKSKLLTKLFEALVA